MLVDLELDASAALPATGIALTAAAAERKGFGGVWGGEANNKDPIVLMSAAAAVTSKITIGTDIVHVFARTPVTTGITAATLDELSRGRFILGVGASNPTIAGWHGMEFDLPLRRTEEYVNIVRQVFQREKLEYEGKRYSSRGFRIAFSATSDHLRIYVAALRPKMTALAARIADGVMINMPTVEHAKKQVALFLDEARAVGRDPTTLDIVAIGACCVNPDLERAQAPMRTTCAFYGMADFYRDMYSEAGFAKDIERIQAAYRDGGFQAARARVTEEMLAEIPAIASTSVEGVKARLAPFEAAGIKRMILAYGPATDDGTTELLRFIEAW